MEEAASGPAATFGFFYFIFIVLAGFSRSGIARWIVFPIFWLSSVFVYGFFGLFLPLGLLILGVALTAQLLFTARAGLSIAAHDVPLALTKPGFSKALALLRAALLFVTWSLAACIMGFAAVGVGLEGFGGGAEGWLGELTGELMFGSAVIIGILIALSSVAYFLLLPVAACVALFPRSRFAEIARRYADIDSEIVALGRKTRAWVGGSKPKVRDIISPPIAVPAR